MLVGSESGTICLRGATCLSVDCCFSKPAPITYQPSTLVYL